MSEKVHLIERPRHCTASAPASWRLVWGDQNHLVVSFGNTVQTYVVKEAPPSTGGAKTTPGLGKIGSMMTQSTMGMGSLVKQTAEHSVELAHQFRLDSEGGAAALGLALLDLDWTRLLAVLVARQPGTQPQVRMHCTILYCTALYCMYCTVCTGQDVRHQEELPAGAGGHNKVRSLES